jgi:hypothetical protein
MAEGEDEKIITAYCDEVIQIALDEINKNDK